MIEQILQADRYLNVDQVEQARSLYARVAELDPRNAIAIVGLARCALADGDERGAYELAAKALRIDPQNDMARRMEARLAEILDARGEPVTTGDRSAEAMTPSTSAVHAAVVPPAAPPAAHRSFLDRLRGR